MDCVRSLTSLENNPNLKKIWEQGYLTSSCSAHCLACWLFIDRILLFWFFFFPLGGDRISTALESMATSQFHDKFVPRIDQVFLLYKLHCILQNNWGKNDEYCPCICQTFDFLLLNLGGTLEEMKLCPSTKMEWHGQSHFFYFPVRIWRQAKNKKNKKISKSV